MPFDIQTYFQKFSERKKNVQELRNTHDYNRPGWIEVYNQMRWHIEGLFPSYLFREKYPTEELYWYEWRKKNYDCVTKDAINDAIKDARRMFSRSNFSIRYDDRLKEYAEGANFESLPLKAWLYSTVFRAMFTDPNGVIVPHIAKVPMSVTDPVIFYLKIINSTELVDKGPDYVIYSLPDGPEREKRYQLITDEAFYVVTETSDNFIPEEIYRHGKGFAPYQTLGGIPDKRKAGIVYRSFMDGFVVPGNLALLGASNWKVSDAQNGHPTRVEVAEPCDNVLNGRACTNGRFLVPGENGEYVDQMCTVCKGSGYKLNNKPTVAKVIIPGGMTQSGTEELVKAGFKMIDFVRPPIEGLKYQLETWREFVQDARRAVNLLEIEEAQSAVAKYADREGKYASIESIADWFFDICVPGIVQIIGAMLNFEPPYRNVIIKPTSFRIKSEGELMLEVEKAQQNGAPPVIMSGLWSDYASKRFGSDPAKMDRLEWVPMLDALHPYKTDEKKVAVEAGIATKKQLFASAYAETILQRMQFNNPLIFTSPFAAIVDAWNSTSDELAAEMGVNIAENGSIQNN